MTVPYIVETAADGDSDLSYKELLQLTSTEASTDVVTSQGDESFHSTHLLPPPLSPHLQ